MISTGRVKVKAHHKIRAVCKRTFYFLILMSSLSGVVCVYRKCCIITHSCDVFLSIPSSPCSFSPSYSFLKVLFMCIVMFMALKQDIEVFCVTMGLFVFLFAYIQ